MKFNILEQIKNKASNIFTTIYVDMDGVLAKWQTDVSEEDTYQKDFFLSCKPEYVILDAINLLRQKYRVVILSHAYGKDAINAKRQWLNNLGLDTIPSKFVPYGQPKADYVFNIGKGKTILLDDYSKNLHYWEKSGLTGLKFYNQINGTHGTWTGPSVNYKMTAKEIFDKIEAIINS